MAEPAAVGRGEEETFVSVAIVPVSATTATVVMSRSDLQSGQGQGPHTSRKRSQLILISSVALGTQPPGPWECGDHTPESGL